MIFFVIVLTTDAIDSVSYTHLDVYKRQIIIIIYNIGYNTGYNSPTGVHIVYWIWIKEDSYSTFNPMLYVATVPSLMCNNGSTCRSFTHEENLFY